ncbi:type III-A CRISPR-associated RAMP protein Csm5 [Fervidibacter sacchari]|uniref:CRISPR system Cms protein Csm5 n=1 Tax=Candidatus Fervidibacter sacchari TaxID=1448929 RepID=A0ABT2ELB6_9BACT|nr:type III-A CRISPR-associated RAMP protein Csm5 [Candidatus Fervidibacter sacchari]MCS3918742.1 CRISPR-associated protein Csm5 [Candidatus Fervidibacter sacchari]WKU17508.1 type III-A CRISPR-associated RAMP protein Csm5 [Candidatus Fervidibacter sacchari]
MKWNEPITLAVHILSPVAIGTGERCNSLGFVVDDGKVLVVDERKFIKALAQEGLTEGFRSWLEGQLQQNRRPNLREFLSEKIEAQKRTEILQASVAYVLPLVSPRQRMSQFNLCIKTPDHRPYIPGSELKGAIRTAVLVQTLSGDALDRLIKTLQSEDIKQLAEEIKRLKEAASQKQGRRTEREIQREIRRKQSILSQRLRDLWQTTEWQLLRAGSKDAHNDLFRGVSISDSEPLPTDALRIYAAKRLNMSRDVTVFVEAIAPECETSVTLSVARPDRWLREIGLTNKAGWLDWTKLAQALYEHANAILEFIARKFPQVREKAQWLKEQNKPDEPLVCLGWGQGFLSVTMTEPLLRRHSDAYETLRQAMAQAISQYGCTKQNNFPKTIWAALDRNGQPYDLFGWVKLVRG